MRNAECECWQSLRAGSITLVGTRSGRGIRCRRRTVRQIGAYDVRLFVLVECGMLNVSAGSHCGREASLWWELGAGAGSVVGGALCDVVGIDSARGASGTVVIALSGFRRWSLLGPKPSLISARESGTVLLCHPWSAW